MLYASVILLLFLIFHSIVHGKKCLNEAIDCSEVVKVPSLSSIFGFLP